MTSLQDVLDGYNRAWGETDSDARLRLLRNAWTDDGVYTDPTTVAEGRAQLAELMAAVQQQFPGLRIVQRGVLQQHHDVAAFAWDLIIGGDVVVSGQDFALVDPDGRLRSLTCFFPLPGRVPAQDELEIA